MKGKTLFCFMHENIGQVRKEDAQQEIERLNNMEGQSGWRTDESEFIFVTDETDENVSNPTELSPGFVWITNAGEFPPLFFE